MNNKKIEDSLRRAVNQTPTVDFEKLSAMPFVKMADHDYITRQQGNRKNNTFRRFSAAVSFCLVMLVCISGWFIQNRLPDSVITLDVNPSIEIVTNMRNQILTVKALNEDAQGIVGDKDYKNADLRETMDALLTSMIRQGYLTENKNTIMISVENKNLKKAESLSLQLEEEINKIVSSQNITPDLLRQVFTKDTEASAAAGKYGISEGKTRLIRAIIASGTELSFDALAKMSIEDLFALTEEYTIDLHDMIESDDDYDADEEDESAQPANTEREIDHDSQPDDDEAEEKSAKSDDQAEDHSPEQTIDQIVNNSSEKTTDREEEDSSLSKDPDSDESDSEPSDSSSDESNGTDSDSSDSSSDNE